MSIAAPDIEAVAEAPKPKPRGPKFFRNKFHNLYVRTEDPNAQTVQYVKAMFAVVERKPEGLEDMPNVALPGRATRRLFWDREPQTLSHDLFHDQYEPCSLNDVKALEGPIEGSDKPRNLKWNDVLNTRDLQAFYEDPQRNGLTPREAEARIAEDIAEAERLIAEGRPDRIRMPR